jgi:rod shape-determining protein MreD
MTEFTERLSGAPRAKVARVYHILAVLLVTLSALLLQVYLPHLSEYFSYLDIPLLVVIYFPLMQRSQVRGIFLGSAIGVSQDALSVQPLGLYGIAKTLIGYFSASVSQRFDVENPAIRLALVFFFYLFHQFFFWVETRSLLGLPMAFDVRQTVAVGVLNGALAIPLYALLDRLRKDAEKPLRIVDQAD